MRSPAAAWPLAPLGKGRVLGDCVLSLQVQSIPRPCIVTKKHAGVLHLAAP